MQALCCSLQIALSGLVFICCVFMLYVVLGGGFCLTSHSAIFFLVSTIFILPSSLPQMLTVAPYEINVMTSRSLWNLEQHFLMLSSIFFGLVLSPLLRVSQQSCTLCAKRPLTCYLLSSDLLSALGTDASLPRRPPESALPKALPRSRGSLNHSVYYNCPFPCMSATMQCRSFMEAESVSVLFIIMILSTWHVSQLPSSWLRTRSSFLLSLLRTF